MTYEIALTGNPNTGKSSIFNALTKLKQHTGNWPGKTVSTAQGHYIYNKNTFKVIDTPGAYSLMGFSEEEIVARDYICFHDPDVVVVVCDATTLERNMNFLFGVLDYHKKVILVINMIDEAIKNGITINKLGLLYDLGIPIVYTNAKENIGIDELKATIYKHINNEFKFNPINISYDKMTDKYNKIKTKLFFTNNKELLSKRILDADDSFFNSYYQYFPNERINVELLRDLKITKENRNYIIKTNFETSRKIIERNVTYTSDSLQKTKNIDKVLTSKKYGIPIMLLLLFVVFFITIKLANYPSSLLLTIFDFIGNLLFKFFNLINLNNFIANLLINGVYTTLTNVISVMLPPMAIFFPFFTFLEDLGYLPRIAYNLDHHFKKCGCHGKQSLTMCMGLGCNASGVIGTRIIDSKRERLIAIITNTFIPCNGRFPLIFTLAATFFTTFPSPLLNAIVPGFVATIIIFIGIMITMLVSKFLAKTMLKGEASTFSLELPPYRKPKLLAILYTSFIDRTLFVLKRAIIIAAPAGAIIFLLSNIFIEDVSISHHLANFLNSFGITIGMDGVIILAFILALPANEIVLPLIIMLYSVSGSLAATSLNDFQSILIDNGWTIFTAINVLLFSLLHFPCSTTLLTIFKETKSIKWTIVSFFIPTLIAVSICFFMALIF